MNHDSVLNIAADLIAGFEGFSASRYKDSVGIETFGYGSLVKYHPDVTFPISEDNAKAILKLDMESALDCISKNVRCDLTDNQAAALCSFIYNLGCGSLRTSTLLKLLNGGAEPATVAEQFIRWDKAGGEVVAGLTRRRKAEAELFLKT